MGLDGRETEADNGILGGAMAGKMGCAREGKVAQRRAPAIGDEMKVRIFRLDLYLCIVATVSLLIFFTFLLLGKSSNVKCVKYDHVPKNFRLQVVSKRISKELQDILGSMRIALGI